VIVYLMKKFVLFFLSAHLGECDSKLGIIC